MLPIRNRSVALSGIKDFNLLIIILLILLLSVSCATQHKYTKKAEPCPCEKTNRR
jgi:hypothetical protein